MSTKRRCPPVGTLFFLLLSGQLLSPAQAADDASGWYLGASFGRALSSFDRDDIDSGLDGAFSGTLTLKQTWEHKSADIWTAQAGYMFSPYLGLEAGFIDVGAVRFAAKGSQSSLFGSSKV